MEKFKSFFKTYWILILIVAAKMVLQFVVVNPFYELHRDEFLHLDQANHLAFGFISLPPLTSIISNLIFLLGGDMFWIRFFPALSGAFTIVFAWLIVEELGGSLFTKILIACGLLFSALVRLNILFQPNAVDILVWTIIFYLLVRYVRNYEIKWLFLLSIAVAFGFYNKYNVIFLLAGLFTGLVLTPQRKIFAGISFWKAFFLTVILLLPNLTWQINNHFPVIDHMMVLKSNQLDNNTISGFLRNQSLFFIGSFPLIIAALLALVLYKPFRAYRFIAIAYVTIILLFVSLRAKDYYAIGLYPVLIAFGGVYLEKILAIRHRHILFISLITANIVLFLVISKVLFPLLSPSEIVANEKLFEKTGMLRWEDGKNHQLPQDFADMTGWVEMAEKALFAYRKIPEIELPRTLVFCDNYGQAGALNYYNRGLMKEAYSFNTDYIYWLPRLDSVQNVVFVGNKPEAEVVNMFRRCMLVGVVENEFARENGTGIYLFTGANASFTQFFYKEAEERKRTLDIF